jgi:hypothetical protein
MRNKDVRDRVLVLGRDKKAGNGEERRARALALVGDADDTRAPGGRDAATAAAAAAAVIASGGSGVEALVVVVGGAGHGHGAHAVVAHFLCWFEKRRTESENWDEKAFMFMCAS